MSSMQRFDLESYQYQRQMGAYRPHFEGKPDDFWEVTWVDIISGIIVMLFAIACFGGFLVGTIYWNYNVGTDNFAIVWSIISIVYIVVFVILAFFGSRHKKKIERQLIKQAIANQMKVRTTQTNGHNENTQFNLKNGKAITQGNRIIQ